MLSALPLVNAANCCCCLWVVLGGVLAAYLQQQSIADAGRRPATARSAACSPASIGALSSSLVARCRSAWLMAPMPASRWRSARSSNARTCRRRCATLLEQLHRAARHRASAGDSCCCQCCISGLSRIFSMLGALPRPGDLPQEDAAANRQSAANWRSTDSCRGRRAEQLGRTESQVGRCQRHEIDALRQANRAFRRREFGARTRARRPIPDVYARAAARSRSVLGRLRRRARVDHSRGPGPRLEAAARASGSSAASSTSASTASIATSARRAATRPRSSGKASPAIAAR